MMVTGPLAFLPPHSAGVILADPPWYFRTYSRKGWKKTPHEHYDCMELDEIKAMRVADLCLPDCLLFLWTTQAFLPQSLEVMTAWGFTYKTQGSWLKLTRTGEKLQFGTGYRLRSCCEFFLIGAIGSPQQLSRSTRNVIITPKNRLDDALSPAIIAPVREHSSKPDEQYALIETTWPGPYVELFARAARPGWTSCVRPWTGRVPAS